MKKILTGMLIALSTMSMVFAQGAGETKTSGTTPERTVLKLAVQADSTPATQSVIDAFNASQDTYTVKWVDMTNDSNAMREQLLTSLKSGSSDYDVLSMDVVWAGEFAASGYIEPLDERMKNDGLKTSQFNAGSMASGRYNAKQYVLPFFPDLGVLFFRSDIV
ncbi:MAG: extracellular solute-binding protein, partial [Spirochaetaceae bacterium]|nr:extracellular solute-binding protein [Spirochaetaceae bacterium]